MLKKLSLILVLISFFGCKENKSNNSNDVKTDSEQITEPKEKPIQKEIFSVKLNGVFDKDDKVALFYIENDSEKYNAQKLVVTKYSGSDEIQEINLELPEKVYPMNIKLDFGSNKEQSSIKIYECILKYKNESYIIKGSELQKYFYFNDGIKIQSDSTTFKLTSFKFHGKELYNPYIVGKGKLTEVLDFEL